PQGSVGHEADLTVAVVLHVGELGRQLGVPRLVGGGRQLAREGADASRFEGRFVRGFVRGWISRGAGDQRMAQRRRRGDRRQDEAGEKESTSPQSRLRIGSYMVG